MIRDNVLNGLQDGVHIVGCHEEFQDGDEKIVGSLRDENRIEVEI